jgi:hypothetical protein
MNQSHSHLAKLCHLQNSRDDPMAKITSKKLGAIIAACEDAYADACREGYGENPAVSAAIAAVKSAHKNWVIANRNLRAAKGFFRIMTARLRADHTSRLTHRAYIRLQSALEEAAAENHLHNRCLLLLDPNSKVAKAVTAAA